MLSCFPQKEDCVRDTFRNDFLPYRQWFGLVPPDHETSIHLGDLGSFTPQGSFHKLGGIFTTSEKMVKEKSTIEKWVGISRPSEDEISMSEGMVFDPFTSSSTSWKKVIEDRMKRYILEYLVLKVIVVLSSFL
jgi:hypothetical protein